MKNLISMTDFVLQDVSMYGLNIVNYAHFLKQPLEPWMFVPCKLVDGVWVVLEEPKDYKSGFCQWTGLPLNEQLYLKSEEYQQAKEKCLFEGFNFSIQQIVNIIKLKITIEDLVKYNIQLTPTAQKQLL